jgi:hypothetical protein
MRQRLRDTHPRRQQREAPVLGALAAGCARRGAGVDRSPLSLPQDLSGRHRRRTHSIQSRVVRTEELIELGLPGCLGTFTWGRLGQMGQKQV